LKKLSNAFCCTDSCTIQLASSIPNFLKRETNKAFAKVLGDKVNRGAGYGLEIPYSLYGPKPYAKKMKELVDLLVERTGLIARLYIGVNTT